MVKKLGYPENAAISKFFSTPHLWTQNRHSMVAIQRWATQLWEKVLPNPGANMSTNTRDSFAMNHNGGRTLAGTWQAQQVTRVSFVWKCKIQVYHWTFSVKTGPLGSNPFFNTALSGMTSNKTPYKKTLHYMIPTDKYGATLPVLSPNLVMKDFLLFQENKKIKCLFLIRPCHLWGYWDKEKKKQAPEGN